MRWGSYVNRTASRRLWLGAAVTLAAAGSAVVWVAPVSGSSGGGTVTLTVGVTQDVDSPNVTVGYTVAAYELWNLQYATLTDKAADDFATIPGLASTWDASDDGLTYTYHLREGLKWSDGQPLTAEDVAWTVNTSRDQEWYNHSSVTANLDAVALDDAGVKAPKKAPRAPKELTAALGKNAKAKEAFSLLAPSHKRNFGNWIATAKRPETKQRRVQETVSMLLRGEKIGDGQRTKKTSKKARAR